MPANEYFARGDVSPSWLSMGACWTMRIGSGMAVGSKFVGYSVGCPAWVKSPCPENHFRGQLAVRDHARDAASGPTRNSKRAKGLGACLDRVRRESVGILLAMNDRSNCRRAPMKPRWVGGTAAGRIR